VDRVADITVVRLEGISKSFGAVKANDAIDLDIRAGHILALLGENGAGKSTLMSILAGRFRPDAGRILVDGRETVLSSTKDAIRAGIGMVYQHFMLVPTMTVAQNVLLGQEGGFWLNRGRMEARVAELAEFFGLAIDPAARVSELSMGERQRVEILRLLARDSRVLIFDEPTAVLTPPEIVHLFAALKAMANRGKAIVFISHKLEEVLSLSDDIAILSRGRVVDRVETRVVCSKAELASRMVGREVFLEVEKEPLPPGEVVLEMSGVTGFGLKEVSLTLRQGEVLAVVGVAGNGQKALVETVTGFRRPATGKVNILGREWTEFFRNPDWKHALAYIPEDRLGLATCPNLDMVDNVLLTTRQGFTRGPFMEHGRARQVTADMVRDFDIQPARIATPAGKLSGGNLQKLVLAREFYRAPRLIVAEQPSQGLDVKATEEVWRQLLAARACAGILLVSGDLSEALQLADRIAVMFRGRFMDVFPVSDTAKVEAIGLAMAGVGAGH
jgi:simple sugar transport system ATP-binding protein